MSTIDQIATKIVKEQELVIGPLAWDEANKVTGLKVLDKASGQIELQSGNPSLVIDQLVARYERIFGRLSKEVCKEAAAQLVATLPSGEVPLSLK